MESILAAATRQDKKAGAGAKTGATSSSYANKAAQGQHPGVRRQTAANGKASTAAAPAKAKPAGNGGNDGNDGKRTPEEWARINAIKKNRAKAGGR